jgi:hypothetical protein
MGGKVAFSSMVGGSDVQVFLRMSWRNGEGGVTTETGRNTLAWRRDVFPRGNFS